jgi:hypothetical protein
MKSSPKSKASQKRLHNVWILLPLTLLLASCGTSGNAIDVKPNNDAACAAFAPIFVGKDDVLTDQTAKAILAHDKTGAKLCGWTPHPKDKPTN